MQTIYFNLSRPFSSHPHRDARPMFRKALIEWTELFQENRIDIQFSAANHGIRVTSETIFVGGQHYRGRSLGPNHFQLHNGEWGSKRMEVFKSVQSMAAVSAHEWGHGIGLSHVSSKNCLMHPHSPFKLCTREVDYFRRKYGRLETSPPVEDATEDQIQVLLANVIRRSSNIKQARENIEKWQKRNKRDRDRIKRLRDGTHRLVYGDSSQAEPVCLVSPFAFF